VVFEELVQQIPPRGRPGCEFNQAAVGLARIRERLPLPDLDVQKPLAAASVGQPERLSFAVVEVEDVRHLVDDVVGEGSSVAW